MANESEKYIKTSLYGSASGRAYKTNTPTQYQNQQKQYMNDQTRRFIAERAYLSSDFVVAEVQGITENFYDYVTTKIRFSDVIPKSSLTKKNDDFKEVLFADPKISYIPVGAKIKTMGSTWLVTNPSNISSVYTTAIVVRCNTSYNSYTDYGALVTEPIYVEKASMLGNDDFTKQNLVLIDGYFNVICQLNENTQKLGHNQRIMLGTMPYHITGFTDFIQEFSGDRSSVHLLNFTARLEEVTNNDDDDEDYVANGNVEEYSAMIIGGVSTVSVGNTLQLSAALLLNGDEVASTDETPINWVWSVSDDKVINISKNGLIEAVEVGSAVITATLAQNEEISATFGISVTVETDEPYVKFTRFSDMSIGQYDSKTYTAAYFENGVKTQEPITWSFSGASEIDYTAEVEGNTVTITCDSASDIPLTLTASCNGKSVSINIDLEGY